MKIFEEAPELQRFQVRGGHQLLHHWSHAVFALAVLLLLSGYLYLPGNAVELLRLFKGLLPLSLGLLVYYCLWRAQQVFLLRYGLADRRTQSLFFTGLLISVCSFFPLRYLLDWLSACFYFLLGRVLSGPDFLLQLDQRPEWIPEPLLGWILIGAGLAVLTLGSVFYLLHEHARLQPLSPVLSAAECILTRHNATRWLTVLWVSALSILLSFAGLLLGSGLLLFAAVPVYLLIWILAPWQVRKSYRQLRLLEEEL